MIKSGGEWISSVQLELEIARHPDVAQAAVIGVPDDRWDERPCALVVLRVRVPPRPWRSCARRLLETVPKWWVPERWALLDELPLTSVGKFDKRAMRGRFADGGLDIPQLLTAGLAGLRVRQKHLLLLRNTDVHVKRGIDVSSVT